MTLPQQFRLEMPTGRSGGARRISMLLMALLVVAAGLTGCNSRELGGLSHQLINNERIERGGEYLTWDDEAAAKAQSWAEQMAGEYAATHSKLTAGITSNWRYLGENVGAAADVDEAHEAFMKSASHRDTILSPRYDRIGIGVAERNGMTFVAQVFVG